MKKHSQGQDEVFPYIPVLHTKVRFRNSPWLHIFGMLVAIPFFILLNADLLVKLVAFAIIISLFGWGHLRAVRWARKFVYYVRFLDDELLCVNKKGEELHRIPKEKVRVLYVNEFAHRVHFRHMYLDTERTGGSGRTKVKIKYIALMFFDGKPRLTIDDYTYNPDSLFNDEYMLIAYTPETLEILKEHLDVPVIIEDEEK